MTDQAPEEERAVRNVFPDVKHMLCTWHIMKNFMKKCREGFKTENGKEVRKIIHHRTCKK
jgi:transposase-like protein